MDELTPDRAPSSGGRILALDGIRGLACVLVVLWHYVSTMQYDAWPLPVRAAIRGLALSWCGVDLFFVLSGFLLGGICLKYRHSSNFFRVFYTRRIFRVVPLYAVWIGLWLALPLMIHGAAARPVFMPAESAWPYAAFLQNLWFAARGAYGPTWMAVTWSLAVEEQFYLILPALIRWVPARRLQTVLVLLILTGPLARAAAVFGLPSSQAMAAYWLLPCRWDAMFLGVLAALWTQDDTGRQWAGRHLPAFKLVLASAGIALVALLAAAPDKKVPVTAILGFSLIDLFFVAMVVVGRFDTFWGRWLSWKPLVWLGSLSFGVYLFHLGLLGLLLALFRGEASNVKDWGGLLVMVLAAAATLGLAWLSLRYFELPILRWGQRRQYAVAEPPFSRDAQRSALSAYQPPVAAQRPQPASVSRM